MEVPFGNPVITTSMYGARRSAADDVDAVPFPHLLQSLLEGVARLRGCEKRGPAVTTERNEMEVVGLLKAVESAGHDRSVLEPGDIYRDECHCCTCPPCLQRTQTRVGHPANKRRTVVLSPDNVSHVTLGSYRGTLPHVASGGEM